MSVGGVAQPRMEANPNPQAHVMPSPSQPPQQPQPGFNQFTDWSMGFGRIPQQPSFFNPYMGNYNPYPQFGGFGGFPQPYSPFSGGYSGGMMHGDTMYRGPGATGGGPMGGGMGDSAPFGNFRMGGGFGGFGGFNPMMGGIGSFLGFGGYQPFNPQPGMGLQQGIIPLPISYNPRSQMPTIPYRESVVDAFVTQPPQMQPQPATGNFARNANQAPMRIGSDAFQTPGGMPDYAALQRLIQSQQRDPNAPPPGMMRNPEYTDQDHMKAMTDSPNSQRSARPQFIRDPSQPEPIPFGRNAFSPEAPPGYTPGPAVEATRAMVPLSSLLMSAG